MDAGPQTSGVDQFPKRYVALKVMYFGQRFYGFASEAHMDPTVESEIFRALKKTKLIDRVDKKELQYSRCGRTDKGVSSTGQVIALFLRSSLKQTRGNNEYAGDISPEESYGEIDYVGMINKVLPKDIQVMGWSPAPVNFSSRQWRLLGRNFLVNMISETFARWMPLMYTISDVASHYLRFPVAVKVLRTMNSG